MDTKPLKEANGLFQYIRVGKSIQLQWVNITACTRLRNSNLWANGHCQKEGLASFLTESIDFFIPGFCLH